MSARCPDRLQELAQAEGADGILSPETNVSWAPMNHDAAVEERRDGLVAVAGHVAQDIGDRLAEGMVQAEAVIIADVEAGRYGQVESQP